MCSSGHPYRLVKRPKKYINTSSSDVDKVTNRNDNCDLDTIDIVNDINEIRNGLNVYKENEAIRTQYVSPSMTNNSSVQIINSMEQSYNPVNVNRASEQCSIPEKTYTELLPLTSISGANVIMRIILLYLTSPQVHMCIKIISFRNILFEIFHKMRHTIRSQLQ